MTINYYYYYYYYFYYILLFITIYDFVSLPFLAGVPQASAGSRLNYSEIEAIVNRDRSQTAAASELQRDVSGICVFLIVLGTCGVYLLW